MGTAGQVLTVNSGATNIQWSDPTGSTGGGTKTYAVFTPLDAVPPATNFATLDTRNANNPIPVLEFNDAIIETSSFIGIMPEAAVVSSGLKVRIHWMADTATSGGVRWAVAFEKLTHDLDDDDPAIAIEGTGTANATSGVPTITEITVASGSLDSVVAGDAYRLKISRIGNDGVNDNMSGDAQLFAVEIRSGA